MLKAMGLRTIQRLLKPSLQRHVKISFVQEIELKLGIDSLLVARSSS